MRQVADHSTFLAPYNAFVYLCSAVPNRPMLTADDLPELRHLQASWETIRDEALALWQAGDIRTAAKHDDLAFNSFYKRDWRRFYVKWYGDVMPSARTRCPRTVALLDGVPSVHAAMFAVLAPQQPPGATPRSVCRLAALPPGPEDAQRGHVPHLRRRAAVHVARRRGRALRRDLHPPRREPHRQNRASSSSATSSARSAGASPPRSIDSRSVTSCRATATANTDEDRVGVANRVFERVYTVRLVMKRLKARSRFDLLRPQLHGEAGADLRAPLAGAALSPATAGAASCSPRPLSWQPRLASPLRRPPP